MSTRPVFGGTVTTGGWVDLVPAPESTIDVWRQALKLSYPGYLDGRTTSTPGAIGAALALHYFADSDLTPVQMNTMEGIGYRIAAMNTNQAIDNILNGLEWAYQNYSDNALELSNQAVIMSQKPPQYPINYSVFGDNSNFTIEADQIHDAPKPVARPNTAPQMLPIIDNRNLPPEQTFQSPETSGIKIATIAAAIASFLF